MNPQRPYRPAQTLAERHSGEANFVLFCHSRLMNIAERYHEVIIWIGNGTGAPDALLHVHAGMAVLLLTRIVTRRSLASPIPFAVVCLAELFNEVMDRLSFGSWRVTDTSLDVLNTLFWPFVLMVGLRVRRLRDHRAPKDAATPADTAPVEDEVAV